MGNAQSITAALGNTSWPPVFVGVTVFLSDTILCVLCFQWEMVLVGVLEVVAVVFVVAVAVVVVVVVVVAVVVLVVAAAAAGAAGAGGGVVVVVVPSS